MTAQDHPAGPTASRPPLPAAAAAAEPQDHVQRRRGAVTRVWSLPPWLPKARLMIAPTIASFLAFVFVVIRPLSDLAGQWAFLVYTSILLFFFPRGRISQQLEANTINYVAAVIGMAYATVVVAIAAWCGGHYGADTAVPRFILGLGLAVLSLTCGFLRSYNPRLNIACRAAMFYPIFLITSEQSVDKYEAWMFLDLFLVATFAVAFSSIFGIALAQHSSSPQLGALILNSVETICELLPASLNTILNIDVTPQGVVSLDADAVCATPPPTSGGTVSLAIVTPKVVTEKALEEQSVTPTRPRQQELARQLRTQVVAARETHAAYTLDVVHARQHPAALIPVIRTLGRLQRNALLGPTGHVLGERIQTALERTYANPTPLSRSSAASTPRLRNRSLSSHRSVDGLLTVRDDNRSRHHHHHAKRSSTAVSGSQLASKLAEYATHSTHHQRSGSGDAYPSPARTNLTVACTALSDAIIAAFQASVDHLSVAGDWSRRGKPGETGDKAVSDVHELKADLNIALAELQKRLSGIVDTTDLENAPGDSTLTPQPSVSKGVTFEDKLASNTVADWLDDEDRFRIAFYMIALLDLAKDATHLLDVAIRLRNDNQPKRWIFPAVIWPWTRRTADSLTEGISGTDWTNAVDGEVEEPVLDPDSNSDDLDFVNALLRESRPKLRGGRSLAERITIAWRTVWDRHGVVRGRVLFSRFLHSLKHSRHVLFSLKQTIGVSLLSIPAFLPPGSPGRAWYESSRVSWMVVSYMYVLEVTTGATLRIGLYRMLGTFIGAVLGYVCALIAHNNAYALVVLATACSVPITYVILFTHVAPLAVITGITLPPILFVPYLGDAYGRSVFDIAWTRFVDIFLGIAAAVLVGSWLWPIHARVQYFRAMSSTLEQITEYYLRMSRDNLRPSTVYQAKHKHYSVVEAAVRRNIELSRNFVDIQRRELSLLPRPIKLYSEIIDCSERLIEAFTEIRTLRFSVPRKATVLDVMPIRRELVSAMLINLWACAQAFRSRSPLPQLLPSPRVPLGEVMEASDEHARDVRAIRARQLRRRNRPHTGNNEDDSELEGEDHGLDENPESHHAELAVLYGMAENEALGEACNSIDELLAAARTLFGTQSFLDPAAHQL